MNQNVSKLIALSALAGLWASCGSYVEKLAANEKALKESSTQEQNQVEMYLDDVLDSAGETPPTQTQPDPSAANDVKTERINQMAEKMFARLDSDTSQTLSLEEFLVAPKDRAEKTKCSGEKAEKMTTKLTEDFKKYAGEDAQLTKEELKTLLTASAPRVGKHRGHKHPGGHGPREKQSFQDVLSQFDANKDGQIGEAEFKTWQESKKPRRGPKGGPPAP